MAGDSWLVGSGAVAGERRLVAATALVGAASAVLVARLADVGWSWWQWLLVVVVALDVVGGVAANGLGSAKSLYHRTPRAGLRRHDPRRDAVVFAALHLHPFLLVLLLPGGGAVWAVATYAACVGGAAAVRAVPLHLKRPVGLAVAAAATVLLPATPEPTGLPWFAPVLVLKLVVAHAVPEEPYRPGDAADSR